MRWQRSVSIVDAHCEGEIGRVVVSGLPSIPGGDPAGQLLHLNEVDDSLRRFLVMEPRGFAQMSTNILVPKTVDEADAAFIILQPDKAHAMSGSNSICVTTVLLETGMVPMREPTTTVRLQTAAGLVTALARCRDGKCESVTLTMTPAFVEALDVPVALPGLGEIKVDIAYGGCFYALVDTRQFGLTIAPENARRLVDVGMQTLAALAGRTVVHPEIPAIRGISYAMLTGFAPDGRPVGATVLPPGRLDRSPCGTGNAARMAVRAARGEVKVGDAVSALSTIGGTFEAGFTGTTTVAGRSAVNTTITGRGWIHGRSEIGWQASDPFPHGFFLTDTWGEATSLMLPPRGPAAA